MIVKRTNSSLIKYKRKLKAKRNNIHQTVLFFSYVLILLQEALERKGFSLKKYKSCELLDSLCQLQKLNAKKKQLFTPYLEMSSTISDWLSSEESDVGYITDAHVKLQAKLKDPLSDEEWKRFYSTYTKMMKLYYSSSPVIFPEMNENLPKPWLSQEQEGMDLPQSWRSQVQEGLDLPKPWVSQVQESIELPKPWLLVNKSVSVKKKKK